MPYRRHHRPGSIPPAMIATLVVAAMVAAVAPFVIVMSGLEWGEQRDLRWALAAIALFFLVLPLALRVLGGRSRKEVL
jgi:hypothetical protein